MSQKRRVLVVDDEKLIRDLITNLLTKNNFEVICAEDGAEALELFEEVYPDIVVTDFKMPRMDGISFLAALWEKHPSFPVIFMSGHFNLSEELGVLAEGCTRFYPKPLDPEELLSAINELINNSTYNQ
ncbi:MAG: response regulator [Planctomycetes bacterium]|nr:response regulator [Planctomycetota bacterium]